MIRIILVTTILLGLSSFAQVFPGANPFMGAQPQPVGLVGENFGNMANGSVDPCSQYMQQARFVNGAMPENSGYYHIR